MIYRGPRAFYESQISQCDEQIERLSTEISAEKNDDLRTLKQRQLRMVKQERANWRCHMDKVLKHFKEKALQNFKVDA